MTDTAEPITDADAAPDDVVPEDSEPAEFDGFDEVLDDEPDSRWPSPLAIAACAAIGAGAIHASVVGGRGDDRTVALLFAWTAAVQIVWGVMTLLHPRPLATALGMAANFGFAAAWLFTRLEGVSFIDGLAVRERVQFADAAAAGLSIVAAAIAFGALLIPESAHRHRLTNIAVPAFVVAALALPAMITTATHVHGADTDPSHGHGAAPAVIAEPGPAPSA